MKRGRVIQSLERALKEGPSRYIPVQVIKEAIRLLRSNGMSANKRQVGGSHYAAGLQHWDVVELHGIGYLEGCATKYLTRWRKKNGRQDLEKALHYTEKLVELTRAEFRANRGMVPMPVLDRFVIENELELTEKAALIGLFRWRKVEDLERAAVFIRQLITEAINAQSRPSGS